MAWGSSQSTAQAQRDGGRGERARRRRAEQKAKAEERGERKQKAAGPAARPGKRRKPKPPNRRDGELPLESSHTPPETGRAARRDGPHASRGPVNSGRAF